MVLEAGSGRASGDVWAALPAARLKVRESLIAPAEREQRYGQVPVTVLLVGLTAAFEEPKSPDLVLQTVQISVDESVHRIVELMKTRGYLREPPSRR